MWNRLWLFDWWWYTIRLFLHWSTITSGETWNVMKIGFQLKQVRERLAKGLVDKGVLRTEKRNFLLFDMATHPVADVRTKESIVTRVVTLLTSTTTALPAAALDKEGVQCRVMRAVCLVCAAYTASVLDNAFGRLAYEDREGAFQRCDEILGEFICWPFGTGGTNGAGPSVPATAAGRRRQATRIASGGGVEVTGRDVVLGLLQEVKKESIGGDEDLGFELVAGVLEVLSKLDSLIWAPLPFYVRSLFFFYFLPALFCPLHMTILNSTTGYPGISTSITWNLVSSIDGTIL